MTCKTDVERIHKNFILWLKINFNENKTLHTESTDYGTEYSNKKNAGSFYTVFNINLLVVIIHNKSHINYFIFEK